MNTDTPRRERAWERKQRRDAPIVAYVSRIKMIVLAIPCLIGAGLGGYAVVTGVNLLGGGTLLHAGAAAVGLITAVVLLRMGFDTDPVLTIDDTGVTCRQPDIGTIPWHAVVGIGLSRPALFRRMLMVAVDESAIDEKARRHAKRLGGPLSILSPRPGRHRGEMRNKPTISISVSYFTMSPRELERQLSEKIQFKGS